MKRYWCLVLAAMVCWSPVAFGQAANEEASRPAAQEQNRALQLIADVYVSDFKNALDINDDQYLRIGTFVRQFIQQRFRVANQRAVFNQRRAQLLAQPNPSEGEVEQLRSEMAQFERNASNTENAFLNRVQSELTPRQLLMVQEFNRGFFEDKLPQLLDRARAEAANRVRPANRPNVARPTTRPPATTRPADTFRRQQQR